MPRRKLQFSLLTLFLLITLCAVGLGVWRWMQPRVEFDAMTLSTPSYPEGTNPMARAMWLEQPVTITRGRKQQESFVALVVCTPLEYEAFKRITSGGEGLQPWQLQWRATLTFDRSYDPEREVTATILYDARKQTVTWNGKTLLCPLSSVIVVTVDDDLEPHVSIDDGTFTDKDIPPYLRVDFVEKYAEITGQPEPW